MLVYAKRVFVLWRMCCVEYSVHVRFRTLLFPARQVNGTRPVSPGPGNPALRQENRRDAIPLSPPSGCWGTARGHLPVRLASAR